MQTLRRQFLMAGVSGLLVRPAAATPLQADLVANVIDIAPWGRLGREGGVGGVYAEIFNRLASLSGCSLELRLTPIKRAVAEVSAGLTQATIMLEREDLNRHAAALGTVTLLEIEVWLPRGSPVRTLEQLAGKTVATLRGPAYHEEFDADDRILKYPVASARQQLDMIRAGRVDGALGVRQNFQVAMNELRLDNSLFGEPLWLGSRRVLLWVARQVQGQPCAVKMGQALARMRSAGEIDPLIARSVQESR